MFWNPSDHRQVELSLWAFLTKKLDVLLCREKTILKNTSQLMQWWGVGYLELQGMSIYLFIVIVIIYKNKMCFPICILATSSSDGWCLSFANFPKGSSVRLCCFGHSNSGLWQQWLLARIINHNSNFSRLHFTRPYQFREFQWKQIYLVPYSWVIELNRV